MADLTKFPMEKVLPKNVPDSPEKVGEAATVKSVNLSTPANTPPTKVWGEEEADEKSLHNPVNWLPFQQLVYRPLLLPKYGEKKKWKKRQMKSQSIVTSTGYLLA